MVGDAPSMIGLVDRGGNAIASVRIRGPAGAFAKGVRLGQRPRIADILTMDTP
jgi:hypothetical protein